MIVTFLSKIDLPVVNNINMETLLNRNQVALKLSVSVEAVKKWEKSGKLPVAGRLNGRPRYALGDVEKLIKRTETV